MFDLASRVDSVAFYHDVDGNRQLEMATDLLLGVDTDGTNGWGLVTASGSLPLGDLQLVPHKPRSMAGAVSPAVGHTTFVQVTPITYSSNNVGQQIRDLQTVVSR